MNIYSEYINNTNKILITFEGDVRLSEITHSLQQISKKYAESSDLLDVIWDFRAINVADLSFEAVDRIAELILDNDYINDKEGQTAYVIDQGAEKHLLNYFVNTLRGGGYKRELHLFHDLEQAKQQLGFSTD